MARHPLLTLLKMEREIIINGDFAALNDLAPRKEKLLRGIAETANTDLDLRQIEQAVADNQALLQAAMDGVATVIQRLSDVREGRKGFNSYGPKGARAMVGTTEHGFEKKA